MAIRSSPQFLLQNRSVDLDLEAAKQAEAETVDSLSKEVQIHSLFEHLRLYLPKEAAAAAAARRDDYPEVKVEMPNAPKHLSNFLLSKDWDSEYKDYRRRKVCTYSHSLVNFLI